MKYDPQVKILSTLNGMKIKKKKKNEIQTVFGM